MRAVVGRHNRLHPQTANVYKVRWHANFQSNNGSSQLWVYDEGMQRLAAVTLFALIALVSGLQAGQALLKTTIKEYRHDEIDAGVYAAPSGYFDLTCRDEGLCN